MIEKSRLQIPRPTARPGDEPDFSYLELSPAGAVDKPAIGSRARDIEYLSTGLVRVLDDGHEAQGPWNPTLEPEMLQVALRWMLGWKDVREWTRPDTQPFLAPARRMGRRASWGSPQSAS